MCTNEENKYYILGNMSTIDIYTLGNSYINYLDKITNYSCIKFTLGTVFISDIV
jgi:hypothetical protein